jgi:hypothetical protein
MFSFGANAETSRPAVAGKMVMSAPRYTASINQLNGSGVLGGTTVTTTTTTTETQVAEEETDRREAERNACINNNIGVGNTFVWASRYSDSSNYATMTEDLKNPENNTCFVRVELKSDDESRVNVSDIAPKYFTWGETIECGSWVNAADMEKRILDAKKGARIGGIVASAVGGAGIGVGAMELFGNKLINGKVEGQKAKNVSEIDLYRARLLTLQQENPAEYNRIVDNLRTLKLAKTNGKEVSDYAKYEPLINEFVK